MQMIDTMRIKTSEGVYSAFNQGYNTALDDIKCILQSEGYDGQLFSDNKKPTKDEHGAKE